MQCSYAYINSLTIAHGGLPRLAQVRSTMMMRFVLSSTSTSQVRLARNTISETFCKSSYWGNSQRDLFTTDSSQFSSRPLLSYTSRSFESPLQVPLSAKKLSIPDGYKTYSVPTRSLAKCPIPHATRAAFFKTPSKVANNRCGPRFGTVIAFEGYKTQSSPCVWLHGSKCIGSCSGWKVVNGDRIGRGGCCDRHAADC